MSRRRSAGAVGAPESAGDDPRDAVRRRCRPLDTGQGRAPAPACRRRRPAGGDAVTAPLPSRPSRTATAATGSDGAPMDGDARSLPAAPSRRWWRRSRRPRRRPRRKPAAPGDGQRRASAAKAAPPQRPIASRPTAATTSWPISNAFSNAMGRPRVRRVSRATVPPRRRARRRSPRRQPTRSAIRTRCRNCPIPTRVATMPPADVAAAAGQPPDPAGRHPQCGADRHRHRRPAL